MIWEERGQKTETQTKEEARIPGEKKNESKNFILKKSKLGFLTFIKGLHCAKYQCSST